MNQFRSPIDPVTPLVQIVEMRIIAREAYQAIFVGGVGRNLYPGVQVIGANRLPHYFGVNINNGGINFEVGTLSK